MRPFDEHMAVGAGGAVGLHDVQHWPADCGQLRVPDHERRGVRVDGQLGWRPLPSLRGDVHGGEHFHATLQHERRRDDELLL